jgi:DNA repair protein RadA
MGRVKRETPMVAEEEEETLLREGKYERLEDLPGIGPATAQRLRELGFNTVESLATATNKELEPAGISEKKALELIRVARSTLSLTFIRADELLKLRQNVLRAAKQLMRFWAAV